jgi:hypothetical protein
MRQCSIHQVGVLLVLFWGVNVALLFSSSFIPYIVCVHKMFLFSGQVLVPLAFCYILLSLALPSPSTFLPYPVCVYKICPSMKTTARQKGKDLSSLTIRVMLAR